MIMMNMMMIVRLIMMMTMMVFMTYSGQKWSGSEPLCEEINCGKVTSRTVLKNQKNMSTNINNVQNCSEISEKGR